jgi:catechol 2,3-dioxygenase-like lactoylglutathione lyase family enzyme
MLGSARLTAFAATAHPERAKAFYESTLGLRLLSEDGFALVFDCNGTHLRIQKVEAVQPPPFTVLGWQVPDIRETVTGLSRRGVTFERYSFMEQDDLGIWTAPSRTKVAWFKDPDGNILSLAEHESG